MDCDTTGIEPMLGVVVFKKMVGGGYLLEFSLNDAKPDGHYHSLKVRVDREGLQLHARQGYFMQKPDKNK
jgi:hypothetical protein